MNKRITNKEIMEELKKIEKGQGKSYFLAFTALGFALAVTTINFWYRDKDPIHIYFAILGLGMMILGWLGLILTIFVGKEK